MKPVLCGFEAVERQGIMDRAFKIGCRVIFFDSHRVAHNAIVTNWFHGGPDGQTVADFKQKHDEINLTNSPEHQNAFYVPCCNLVYVSDDKNKTDPYGWQLERATSCSYGRQSMTPFLGMCWAWPDEEDEAKELAAKAYAEAATR
jgi:hypothetical protein